jgi:hypothetical protein
VTLVYANPRIHHINPLQPRCSTVTLTNVFGVVTGRGWLTRACSGYFYRDFGRHLRFTQRPTVEVGLVTLDNRLVDEYFTMTELKMSP